MQYLVTVGVILTRPLQYREDVLRVLERAAYSLNCRYSTWFTRPLTRFGSRPLLMGTLSNGRQAPWVVFDFVLETWPDPYGVVIDGPIPSTTAALRPTTGLMSLGVRRERILIRGPSDVDAYRAATVLWEDLLAGCSMREVETLRLMRELGFQKRVAEAMGVTPQAVNDALRRAHWPRLKKSLTMVGRSLELLRTNLKGLHSPHQ